MFALLTEDSCHGIEILFKENHHVFDICSCYSINALVYSVGGLATSRGMPQQYPQTATA